jgi:cyclic dehypoxanthinyl futalosine synthase
MGLIEVGRELGFGRGEVEEYLDIYKNMPLLELGGEADRLRRERHPEGVVSYIVDRNINYTNVCVTDCKFCAFYRRPKHRESYTLTYEEIGRKIDEAKELGAVQILMQGGHNPYLPLEWYTDLLGHIKEKHPIHIHAFSASEIEIIAQVSKLSIEETLCALKDAGLDSMPGAGAEILVDSVRDRIAKKKTNTAGWIEIHEIAHNLGMLTTATMMYGTGESLEDRLEHMLQLKALQARTGGFTAFIPWSMQAQGTEMEGAPEATGMEYLRMVAVSRIVLDNFDNLQVSYVTQGPKMAQVALRFGCNDFGSLIRTLSCRSRRYAVSSRTRASPPSHGTKTIP